MAHLPLPSERPSSNHGGAWYKELNRYHWFVLIVAALGWLFDCLDQQLFILARQPAMRELLVLAENEEQAWQRLEQFTRHGAPQGSAITSVDALVDDRRTKFQAELNSVIAEKSYPSSAALSSADWSDVLERVDARVVNTVRDEYSAYATAIFLIGWASGGLAFGVLGDRIGRARTMIITILMYSLFTGLSALSWDFFSFAIFRLLTGLGVGGEFAVGVALVAEVMPDRARPYCLSVLQALSAIGNISAALIGMGMGTLREAGLVSEVWRPMFVIGAVPALLALYIRRRLKEPERWQRVSHEGGLQRQLGSYRALFRDPRWRKHALVGLAMAFSGVVGLWAVGFFTMDLVGNVLEKRFKVEGLSDQEISGRVAYWKGITSMMINIGAALGMYGFAMLASRLGRKPSFAIAFLAAAGSTAAVFAFLEEFHQIFWMVPLMGFCQLSLFAGYAIYFPELFPTYLRSTGTSFCYNVGRFVAAVGPAILAQLTSRVYAQTDEPLRYAGLTMCSVFLVGLLALPFAPETKDHPLPE